MFAGGVEECGDQARHTRLPHVTVVTPECHSFSVQWELQWRFNRYQPTIFYACFCKPMYIPKSCLPKCHQMTTTWSVMRWNDI